MVQASTTWIALVPAMASSTAARRQGRERASCVAPPPQQPARFNRALSDLRAVDQRSVGIRRGRVMSYAACISTIRDRQRTTNSRRCVANGIDSPGRGGTRKYWRNSSKAAQS